MNDAAFAVLTFFILVLANALAIHLGRIDRKRNARACEEHFDADELMKRIEKLFKQLKGDGGNE